MKINASDADSATEFSRPDSITVLDQYRSDISRYFKNANIEVIWKWHVCSGFTDVEFRYLSDI